jgi:DNA polymerase I
MIVTRLNLQDAMKHLAFVGEWGLDTETTGLLDRHRAFSIILTNADVTMYFNFQAYPDLDPIYVLPKEEILQGIRAFILSNELNVLYIHNAKFDWHMLLKEGIDIKAKVHCTYAIERVLKNNYFGKGAYSLDLCALRRGLKKDDKVTEYITKHKLYIDVDVFGKKEPIREKHFDKVPFEIIAPYGEKDGSIVRALGISQRLKLQDLENSRGDTPSMTNVVENEVALTRTLVKMERHGVLLDVDLIEKAIQYEAEKIREHHAKFTDLTGKDYEDSRLLFREVFDRAGEKYPLTDKGNPSFAGDVLELMDSPIAAIINTIRYHEKRLGTYYSSYLYYKDENDVLHANALQGGTTTGRMSYTNPNMQNVSKEDEPEDQDLPYHLRECFIPRPGHFFYDIDYEQMEYKLMLDYAGEMPLIKRILEGEDLHQATADMVGVSRKQAKTLNFAILYGAGHEKIALMLKVKEWEALQLMNQYFARLPKVERFIDTVKHKAKSRKYIYNWFGRRNYFATSGETYKAPNHLIQGGCADIVKVAMNNIQNELDYKKHKTKMLLQVHDELLFEVPFGEEWIGPRLQEIMEGVYKPTNGLHMTTSISHSTESWGYRHLKKGLYVHS